MWLSYNLRTRKHVLQAGMSHSTVHNAIVSTKKTHSTPGETSTQVVCNAACVQGKRSCKREREMYACASHQAWLCVCMSVIK